MTKRELAMQALYRSGLTLQAIGNRYGITRERVRQILRGHGIGRDEGGQAVLSARRSEKERARIDAIYIRRFGLTRDAVRAIPLSARKAFGSHRRNANSRGIQFDLSLGQWWSLWCASGKWNDRGRTRDRYCMTRSNDAGSYEVGNVQIMTIAENSRLYAISKQGKPRRPKHEQGVCVLYPGTNKPYVAYFRQRKIGTFASLEEARAARNELVREAA